MTSEALKFVWVCKVSVGTKSISEFQIYVAAVTVFFKTKVMNMEITTLVGNNAPENVQSHFTCKLY
jgi:hypothetical protein